MGNCHSSHDPQSTAHDQHSAVQEPLCSHLVLSQSSKKPNQKQSDQGYNDVWSPPPYSSTSHTTTTPPVATSSSAAPGDDQYAFLRDFDTIFLVDDSSSMYGERWREAENAIAAIAPICTYYDADGIDIYFLNNRNGSVSGPPNAGGYKNVTDASGVREIFKSVSPSGATPVGSRLHDILAPYMRDLARSTSEGRKSELKPLNIIVITDGAFTDDAGSVIVGVAKQLDQPGIMATPWQVGIQFFQVGHDQSAKEYLEALDNDLVSYEGIRDIVDTVPWKGERGEVLNAEGILKCVLGAVNKKYDKQEASRYS